MFSIFNVEVLPSALKELAGLPSRDRSAVRAAIDGLESGPNRPGVERLSGYEGYRLRVGRFRVLFTLDRPRKIIIIVKIGPRKHVYRRLERLLQRD